MSNYDAVWGLLNAMIQIDRKLFYYNGLGNELRWYWRYNE